MIEDILKQMQFKIEIVKSFNVERDLVSLHIRYKTIREDSPRNNGFPIVLHWIKVGIDKNAIRYRLFLNFFDKNKTKIGKFIIWRSLIIQIEFSWINGRFA